MPTPKHPKIDEFLTSLTGISRDDASKQGICAWCKNPIKGFRDSISETEYKISGFCQKCQDDTFRQISGYENGDYDY